MEDRNQILGKIRHRLRSGIALMILRAKKSFVLGTKTFVVRPTFRLGLLKAVSQHYDYEAEHAELYQLMLKAKAGAFVDVGANVGQTLLKLLAVDPNRQYVGFEPQISAALDISLFIEDNKLRNHTIMPLALAANNGVIKLGTRFSNDTTASTFLEFRPQDFYSRVWSIPVFSGDFALQALDVDEVSVIKIDVEGAEYEVFCGLKNVIAAHKPFLVFEALPRILRVTGAKLSEEIIKIREQVNEKITSFLHLQKYEIFLIRSNSELSRCPNVAAHENDVLNYVAIPIESLKKLTDWKFTS